MESRDGTDTVMREFQAAFAGSSVLNRQNKVDIPIFGAGSQISGTMRQSLSPDNVKRPSVPPSHPNHHPPLSPYSRNMASRGGASQQVGSQKLNQGPSHSRSLSQSSFFSLDSLPPLSPSTYQEQSSTSLSDPMSKDVTMEDKIGAYHPPSFPSPVGRGNPNMFGFNDSLPPRKGHRRSNSDIPLGFSAMIQSSPQLIPIGSRGVQSTTGRDSGIRKPIELVKRESEWNRDEKNNVEGMGERQSEGEVVDDLFSAYMNLENIDTLNSSGTEDKDLDSRASGTKTNGAESSDNEVESHANGYPNSMQGFNMSTDRKEGLKRSAGGDIAPTSRHYRSVSVDSFVGNLNLDEELVKPPATGTGKFSPCTSMDGKSAQFNMDFGNGEFTGAEMKKIMANDKLSEIAIADPKRAKRILANRQSAARSKERKMRYIAELEHKVQTLQTEATTLSTHLTMLQRDSSGLTNQNNELKFRIQAMEQQAQLRDALNDALSAEVQRLKVLASEFSGDAHLSNCMAQQLSINQQRYQSQNQQSTQHKCYEMQQQQQHQSQHKVQENQLQTPQQNGEASKS